MPTFKPTRELVIAEPCTESWDSMSGGLRERHCSVCDRDVLNVAALTPTQLEAVLAMPGPLPCMRLVQFEDGSVLTAQEEQARAGEFRA